MPRFKIFTIGIVAAALVLSCAPSVSRGEYGNVTVAFGGSSARALASGWPNNTLPTFSSVTVKVSASDMSTVTATASGYSGAITIQAPAGTGRLVELFAVPASGGGAPSFATSYYGSATADLKEGQTTSVAIKLALAETKIVLPNASVGEVAFAGSLTGGVDGTLSDFYFAGGIAFDSYGRLFLSGDSQSGYSGIVRLTNLTDPPEQISTSWATDLTYDASRDRLYALYSGDGVSAFFVDLSGEAAPAISILLPSDFYLIPGGIAVDAQGAVYVTAQSYSLGTNGIAKLSVNGPVVEGTVTASVLDYRSNAQIGIGDGFSAQAMIVLDGVLYVTASESFSQAIEGYTYSTDLISRGKIIALPLSTLSPPIWEAGLSPTGLPNSPNSQFYAPMAFIGVAPKKLYIADDGFTWTDTGGLTSPLVNVDRAVEVNLDTQTLNAADVGVTFIDDYSNFYAYPGGQG